MPQSWVTVPKQGVGTTSWVTVPKQKVGRSTWVTKAKQDAGTKAATTWVTKAKQAKAAELPTNNLWPVKGSYPVTQGPSGAPGFKYSGPGQSHYIYNSNAYDISVGVGTPVYATFDGIVEAIVSATGYGKHIRLHTPDGKEIIYGHLSDFAVSGGQVKAGQLLGYSGSTGWSTGPHLHYEVRGGALPPLGSPSAGIIFPQAAANLKPSSGVPNPISPPKNAAYFLNPVAAQKDAGSNLPSASYFLNPVAAQQQAAGQSPADKPGITIATLPLLGDIKIPFPGEAARNFALVAVGGILVVAALVKWTSSSGVGDLARKATSAIPAGKAAGVASTLL